MDGIADPPDLAHIAAFYRGEGEYLDTVLPFLRAGIDNGDHVFVAIPTDNLALLRDALGDAAAAVDMADMAEVGRNPARAFAMFAATLAAQSDGRRVRMVGEPVWPGRSPEEYPACVQNEALVNTAWAGRDVQTLCPYDAARLSAGVLADARRTHPLIRECGRVNRSADYAWRQAWADYNEPLISDPLAARYSIADMADLTAARTFAARYAQAAGMAAERIGDLHLVITELATNSLKYTGAGCSLALWRNDGKLVCEIRDGGRLDDPLAGRRPASPHATSGRGLLLVNAIADLVRIHSGASDTTIQAHIPMAAALELVS